MDNLLCHLGEKKIFGEGYNEEGSLHFPDVWRAEKVRYIFW